MTAWIDFTGAPCRDAADAMFPPPKNKRQIAAAKAACAGCPLRLRAACLEIALTGRDHIGRWYEGVWAGTTPEDRAELRLRRRGAA